MDRDEMHRRMAQHPNSVSFNEARGVLEAFGWVLDRIQGSHHIFARGAQTLSLPYRRPHILRAYVRAILAATAGDDSEPDDST